MNFWQTIKLFVVTTAIFTVFNGIYYLAEWLWSWPTPLTSQIIWSVKLSEDLTKTIILFWPNYINLILNPLGVLTLLIAIRAFICLINIYGDDYIFIVAFFTLCGFVFDPFMCLILSLALGLIFGCIAGATAQLAIAFMATPVILGVSLASGIVAIAHSGGSLGLSLLFIIGLGCISSFASGICASLAFGLVTIIKLVEDLIKK